MPTTLILGGSGKVGLLLTRILTGSTPPHKVYSVTRSASHADPIQAAGGIPIEHSVEDSSPARLAGVLRDLGPVDNVVWAAGAGGKGGPERTDSVDREGAILSFDAAARAGVRRFVLVSAVDVRDRRLPAPDWYSEAMRERGDASWSKIGRYMEAKLAADRALVEGNGERGLRYTIVRPSGLTEDKGTGKVQAGKTTSFESIAREDVAAVVAEVLKSDDTAGLAFDIVGGDTPIAEAVRQVAENKVDTFEGFH